jgi:predicted dehydrogenase
VTVGAGHSAVGVDQEPEKPPPPNKKWRLAFLCLVGAYVVLACYELIAMNTLFGSNGAAKASNTTSASSKVTASSKARQAAPRQGGVRSSPSAPAAPTSPAPSEVATPTVAPPAWHSLGVTSAVAFGPDGISDGDNPGLASRVVDVSTDQPWYSQWYATPRFGNLRSGTGLLLDMGETVSVKSAQLSLGAAPGADVQVRVGNDADLAGMSPVASAWDVGGTVQLTATTATRGRYVLIWFTRLPPNSQGEYQVDVYGVTIDGTEGA